MSILIYHKDYVLHKDCHHSEPCLGCLILGKKSNRYLRDFFLPNIPNISKHSKVKQHTKTYIPPNVLDVSFAFHCTGGFFETFLKRAKRKSIKVLTLVQNIYLYYLFDLGAKELI